MRKSTYRIAHLADTHLGYRGVHSKRDESGFNIRNQDVRAAFTEAIAAIGREHNRTPIDLFVHAGDIFDNANPLPAEQVAVIRAIQHLAAKGIPQVWIAGNHDVGIGIQKRNFFTVLRAFFGDDHLIAISSEAEAETYDLPGGIQVDAYPHFAVGATNYGLDRGPDTRLRIALAHAEITAAGELVQGSDLLPLTHSYDYIALGHLHGFEERMTAVGYTVMPSGTERFGWRDQHAKTGWVLTTCEQVAEPGTTYPTWAIGVEHRPVESRPMVDLGTIDVRNNDDGQSLLEIITDRMRDEAAARGWDATLPGGRSGPEGAMWRVHLNGITTATTRTARRHIDSHLHDLVWHLQIDSTDPATTWRSGVGAGPRESFSIEALFEEYVTERAAEWGEDFAARFKNRGVAAIAGAREQEAAAAGEPV